MPEKLSFSNPLFPVFLKLENLPMLIVGGGSVAAEKVKFLIKNSPNAPVTLVAKNIAEEIQTLALTRPNLTLHQKAFQPSDLQHVQIVIVATDDAALNHSIHKLVKAKGIIVNVADTPDLCDFYLGAVVTKGDLKIAISTNGKSPTFAKRFREILEEILPDELPQLLLQLAQIRNQLKLNFSEKVKYLNQITSSLVNEK